MRPQLAAAALFVSGLAHAHAADIVYAQLSGKGDGAADELLTMTAATLGLLAPVDANGDRQLTQAELDAGARSIEAGVWDAMPLTAGATACTRTAARAILRDTYVELGAHFQCADGELAQTFKILSVLPGGYRVVLATDLGGARSESSAQGDQQMLTVPDPRGAGQRAEGLLGWLRLGVLHILAGFDHLAFLLALLLVGSSWRQVGVLITAFTVAHSLTLGAGALGFISLDEGRERWAEVAIAVSIIYVAAENLIVQQPRHRAGLTFAFGLVHGLGFATVLRAHGLGQSPVLGLVGFNLGIELGQACIVLSLYPLVRIAQRRKSAYSSIVQAGSFAILCAGGYWLVGRLSG